MQSERERLLEDAQTIAALWIGDRAYRLGVETECIWKTINYLAEAEARGVEWAAKNRCEGCRASIFVKKGAHDWPDGKGWIICASVTEVARAAELRAQKTPEVGTKVEVLP
jgi:hypothetical protein